MEFGSLPLLDTSSLPVSLFTIAGSMKVRSHLRALGVKCERNLSRSCNSFFMSLSLIKMSCAVCPLGGATKQS